MYGDAPVDFLQCIDANCLSNQIGKDNTQTINEGRIECHAPNRQAFLFDLFSCYLFQMPYFLEKIKFGYFTIALVLLVIIVSLFGRIKLNYRWFILNLALIDLILCLDFILQNGTSNNGYFGLSFFDNFLQVSDIFCKIPSIGLFILTGSRFLSSYFPYTYKKLEKTWKIIFIILAIDVIYLSINIFAITLNEIKNKKILECIFNQPIKYTSSNNECDIYIINEPKCSEIKKRHVNDCINYVGWWFTEPLKHLENAMAPLALLFSVIFVVVLLIQITKQLKFQASMDIKNLRANIRIIIVLLIQTNLLIPLFLLDSFNTLRSYSAIPSPTEKKLPYWVEYLTDGDTTIKCFREIRIFIDSIGILIFMSGYREDLKGACLWVHKACAIRKLCEKKNAVHCIPPQPWIPQSVSVPPRRFRSL